MFSTEKKENSDFIISDVMAVTMTCPILFKPQYLRTKVDGKIVFEEQRVFINTGLLLFDPFLELDTGFYAKK